MMKGIIPVLIITTLFLAGALTPPLQAADFQGNAEIIRSILEDSTPAPAPVEEKKEPADPRKKQKEKKKKTAGSAARTAPGTEEEDLRTAVDMFHNGFLDDSLRLLAAFRTKYPSSPYNDTARIWTGKVYLRKLDYDKALAEFSAIPEDSGEYPSALYESATCYITKGENVKAIESLSRLSGRYPGNPVADDALLRMAELLSRAGRGNEAVDAAIRIIREYPESDLVDDAYFFLGHLFETDPSLRDFDLARRFYRAFLKKAEGGTPYFVNSPLRSRVEEDLRVLEKRQFRLSD